VTKTPPPLLPEASPAATERNRLVDEGRALFESDTAAAHALFEKAYLSNLNDLRVMSHYGLTLVLVEGDRQRGIRFCEEAVRRGPVTSEFLINLARALVQTRNKEQAVRALTKAQQLAPDDPAVAESFIALGLRRAPPIGWFGRNFFLNRWLGRLTWKFRGAGKPQLP
jgi:tetratricopeptide (TPR) repeat protein